MSQLFFFYFILVGNAAATLSFQFGINKVHLILLILLLQINAVSKVWPVTVRHVLMGHWDIVFIRKMPQMPFKKLFFLQSLDFTHTDISLRE